MSDIPIPENDIPIGEIEIEIHIIGCSDGVWEYAVWRGETQLVLGHRDTREEAWLAACQRLDKE